MRSALMVVVMLGLGLAAGQGAQAAETELSIKGKALAEQRCSKCHAIGATGDSPHAEAPPFRTFASKWPLENLEESLAEGIVTGHADMPAIALEPDEIAVLIEHIHTISPEGKQPTE